MIKLVLFLLALGLIIRIYYKILIVRMYLEYKSFDEFPPHIQEWVMDIEWLGNKLGYKYIHTLICYVENILYKVDRIVRGKS